MMEPPLVHARQPIADTSWYEMFARTHQMLQTADTQKEIQDTLKERLPDASLGVVRGMAERLYRLDPEVLATLMDPKFMHGYDLIGLLESVTCPTLLIQSDPAINSVLEEADIALAIQHVSDCRHIVIPDAIHTLHFSHPQRVSAAIVEFLSEDY